MAAVTRRLTFLVIARNDSLGPVDYPPAPSGSASNAMTARNCRATSTPESEAHAREITGMTYLMGELVGTLLLHAVDRAKAILR